MKLANSKRRMMERAYSRATREGDLLRAERDRRDRERHEASWGGSGGGAGEGSGPGHDARPIRRVESGGSGSTNTGEVYTVPLKEPRYCRAVDGGMDDRVGWSSRRERGGGGEGHRRGASAEGTRDYSHRGQQRRRRSLVNDGPRSSGAGTANAPDSDDNDNDLPSWGYLRERNRLSRQENRDSGLARRGRSVSLPRAGGGAAHEDRARRSSVAGLGSSGNNLRDGSSRLPAPPSPSNRRSLDDHAVKSRHQLRTDSRGGARDPSRERDRRRSPGAREPAHGMIGQRSRSASLTRSRPEGGGVAASGSANYTPRGSASRHRSPRVSGSTEVDGSGRRGSSSDGDVRGGETPRSRLEPSPRRSALPRQGRSLSRSRLDHGSTPDLQHRGRSASTHRSHSSRVGRGGSIGSSGRLSTESSSARFSRTSEEK